MNLVERAKNIILTPATEWETINLESHSTAELYKSYIVLLAAIGPIASFIGMSFIGIGLSFLGASIVGGLSAAVVHYVLSLVGVFLIALLIDALAPTFGGQKNQIQALKVAAFSYTPAWVAGILHLVPGLRILTLLASLYSLYLLYLGLPVLMKTPKERAGGYAIAVVVCGIVLGIVFGAIAAEVGGFGMGMGRHSMWGYSSNSGDTRVSIDGLKQMAATVEGAKKENDAVKQSSNVQTEIAAAGGAPTDTVDQALLKAMLPEALGSLKRNKLEAEKSSIANFKISKADAGYGDDQGHSVDLSITDAGGTPMFAGLTAWAMIEQDRETDSGYEKMGKVDGRPAHEKLNKTSMDGEYTVIVANRFIVSAIGRKVEMDTLKQAVAGVGLEKLDALKSFGVNK